MTIYIHRLKEHKAHPLLNEKCHKFVFDIHKKTGVAANSDRKTEDVRISSLLLIRVFQRDVVQ